MTYKDGEIHKRKWLKTDHLAITESLRSILEESGMPVREQSRLAYIQDAVLTSDDEDPWAEIPSLHLQKICRDGYKRRVDALCEMNQLAVNPPYSTGTDYIKPFARSYRVPRTALNRGICTFTVERSRLRPPIPDNNPTDEASRYALKCLSELKVSKDCDFYWPDGVVHRSLVKDHCMHIFFHDFALGYGKKSNRLFHRVVMMPSEGRRNLKHWWMPLVEYDVKTCHPFFLLSLFDDSEERKRYHELITQGDIYTIVGDAMGVPKRDAVKKEFMQVMNSGRKDEDWFKKKNVLIYFHQNFPLFTKSVLSQRTDLAIYMQNLEAKMLVQQLGLFCKQNDLFWIPMHDGWISIPSDGEKIKDRAKKIISGTIGFEPEITGDQINPRTI